MMRRVFVVLLLLAASAARAGSLAVSNTAQSTSAPPTEAGSDMSPEAAAELRSAIDILKTHHMNRDKVDWPSVEARAFQIARGTKTPRQTYRAIVYVIRQLREKHTLLMFPEAMKELMSGHSSASAGSPEGIPLDGHMGLLKVPAHWGAPENDRAYTEVLWQVLSQFDKTGICRFIVDLRGNGGGNMWPMVNGIASLLGTPPYGYWIYADKPKEPWVLKDSLAYADLPPSDPKLAASQGTAPIAILIDRGTGSSGEFTAIGLEGRPHTRVFGEPTAGYVTANIGFDLPDGARLLVSVGWSEDRLGRPYRVAVVPDKETPPGQPTLDAATRWLRAQRCSR